MEDLVFAPAQDLAPLLRERKLSPVELVKAFLARIQALDDDLKAFITVTADIALAEAKAAEAEVAAGNWRGPLHGIPVAYKDIIEVADVPTTAASKVLDGYLSREDATVVARLRKAGAVCLGKLNLLEFASGSMEVFGDARNPWNLNYSPGGGSSAGSAVATAAGLATCTLGTDTGGSIRGPAAGCGIVGLKPTYGRVSRAGVIPLSWSLDHVGPMTRSVGDAAIMLQVLAGSDPRDLSASQRKVPDYAASLGRPVAGMRIGVPREFFYEGCDAEVAAALERALEGLRGLGLEIVKSQLPNAHLGPSSSWTIAYTEAFTYHRDGFLKHSKDYTESFLWKITAAGLLNAEERITSQRVQEMITQEFVAALRDVDAIVVPAARRVPTPVIRQPSRGLPRGEDMNSTTRPISLTGLPTLSLPCGFSAAGLPIGFQLVGRSWDEETLFAIGNAWEKLQDWKRYRPAFAKDYPAEEPTDNRSHPLQAESMRKQVDADWAMRAAELAQLEYVLPSHAERLAAMLRPVKSQLEVARQHLGAQLEPASRPAPDRNEAP